MSKKQAFKLIYQVESEKLIEVVRVAWQVISETGMDPESIVLPDGRILPWNEGWAAHQFAAEGRISEEQFIEMSLNWDQQSLISE